jgi:cation transport ATPase
LVAAAFTVAWLAPGLAFWAYLAATAIGVAPIARRALSGALSGTPFSIEALMTVAAAGSVAIGAVEEAAVVIFLFAVGAGSALYAGSINGNGLLRVRITKTAADNTIARIIHLVEEAQAAKAPTARFIDRFAAYYTPAAMIVSGLVRS